MAFDIDNIKHVDPEEALELINQNYVFLDVREQSEWDAGHYKEAVFLPMSTMSMVSIQDTNLTSENFLGFSKASYTDGQTATISLSGAVNTSQVGLSTTKNYYVLPDASLTNSPSVTGQFFNDPEGKYGYISAGIALSTTSLLIKT